MFVFQHLGDFLFATVIYVHRKRNKRNHEDYLVDPVCCNSDFKSRGLF